MRDSIEETRARLIALGCTPDQIALHLSRLAAIAKRKAPATKRKAPPVPNTLDPASLAMVLKELAREPHVRFITHEPWPPWCGLVIMRARGLPNTITNRRTAGQILAWMESQGHVTRGPSVARHGRRQFLVAVPGPPPAQVQLTRTRLRPRPHGEAGASMALA